MNTPLTAVKGIGSAFELKLNSLGLYCAEDVLDFFPKQYVDLSKSVPLSGADDGSFCLFDGTIIAKSYPRKKNNLQIFNAEINSHGIIVKVVWFNQNYVSKKLELGNEYVFFGKIKISKFCYEIANPHFYKKSEENHFFGITPIYPNKGLIPQGTHRNIVKACLPCARESLISREIEEKMGIMSLPEAYKRVHFPDELDTKEAQKRVVLEKLVERIAAFSYAKKFSNRKKNREYICSNDYSSFLRNLDFLPTDSQRNAIEKIISKLKNPTVMNTVLCGDVGSGKTLVAAMASYFVIKNGYQVALAVPTAILAQQHYSFFSRAFSSCGINIALLTGAMPSAEKRKIYSAAEKGELDLIIGTHAVFSEKLNFLNLGLAIADEQHRFGVAQRNSLVDKGSSVDVLTLSATPIPRTMYIAAYGEADFLTIDRRTVGNIKTSIVPAEKRADMFRYVADRSNDTKIYVIAPKILDAEGIEKESCEELYEEMSKYLPEEKIGIMHGKMKVERKNEVMERFRSGEIRVLVATTVVEVGVDVPDATIMIITDADNFGLAALHQLRGRVGRNGQKSFCFLLGKDCDRLKVLTANDDGFKIAEEDFAMRGGGEMFGLEQTGAGSLKYVTPKLLKIATECAKFVDYDKFLDRIMDTIKRFSLFDVTLG